MARNYFANMRKRAAYLSQKILATLCTSWLLRITINLTCTKFIMNYPHDCCYVDRLTSLKLLPLEYQRETHDLTLLMNLEH